QLRERSYPHYPVFNHMRTLWLQRGSCSGTVVALIPRCHGRCSLLFSLDTTKSNQERRAPNIHATFQTEQVMKLIVAVIRPEKLAAVQKALNKREMCQMTVSNVFGSGHERGHSCIYRGVRFEENLIPRLKLEVAVENDCVDSAVNAIRQNANTGH